MADATATADSGPPRWRHRIYLVGTRADRDPADCLRHWTEVHPGLVLELPGLVAYRQNRPVVGDGPPLLCAETWFLDAAAETAAFASAVYRDRVGPDEARFTDGRARHTVVISEHRPDQPGSWRRLSFGSGAPIGDLAGATELLRLRRPLGLRGSPDVRSEWTGHVPDRPAVVRDESFELLCRPRTWSLVEDRRTR